ncbi:hypothetical protein CL622_04350, partial [archaeon]|nr:hypothetical protein [archaeon]
DYFATFYGVPGSKGLRHLVQRNILYQHLSEKDQFTYVDFLYNTQKRVDISNLRFQDITIHGTKTKAEDSELEQALSSDTITNVMHSGGLRPGGGQGYTNDGTNHAAVYTGTDPSTAMSYVGDNTQASFILFDKDQLEEITLHGTPDILPIEGNEIKAKKEEGYYILPLRNGKTGTDELGVVPLTLVKEIQLTSKEYHNAQREWTQMVEKAILADESVDQLKSSFLGTHPDGTPRDFDYVFKNLYAQEIVIPTDKTILAQIARAVAKGEQTIHLEKMAKEIFVKSDNDIDQAIAYGNQVKLQIIETNEPKLPTGSVILSVDQNPLSRLKLFETEFFTLFIN